MNAPAPWWRRPFTVDALLAGVVAALVSVGVTGEILGAGYRVPPFAGGILLGVATAVPLLWRRRYPVHVTVAVFALATLYHLVGYPGWAPGGTLYLAVYALAGYASTNRGVAGAVVACALAYAVPLLPPHPTPATSPAVWGPTMLMLWVVLLGASMRYGRAQAEQRIRQAARLAAAQAQQHMAEDRLRIARELHDVLAHTISVIAVHGGVALDALDDDDPDTTRRAVTTMRSSAKQALTELRATLGLLRGDDQRGTVPQPRLAELPELARRAGSAGLAVDLHLDVEGVDLPPIVELTAYRVVQEALTNVLRHAGTPEATVTVRRDGASLVVRVLDDGPGLPPATGRPDSGRPDGGFGLAGMRERTEALGGTLHAGPRPEGGFEVVADLPL